MSSQDAGLVVIRGGAKLRINGQGIAITPKVKKKGIFIKKTGRPVT